MSRNTGNRSAAPHKGGSPLLTGILIGMVIGAGISAGLAWYLMRAPSPFLQKESMITKTPVDIAQQTAPAEGAAPATQAGASGVVDGKPRFEFYKVLTDKPDATAPAEPAAKQQPARATTVESRPLAADEPYFLQAGSFHNAEDAEKLKARLALLGFESSTQTATIPDKGVWHRVRTGPYKNANEMNQARDLLKQNGVDATPMRAR